MRPFLAFFYWELKHIAENHKTRRFRILHLLESLPSIVGIFRLLNVIWVFAYGSSWQQWKFDPFLNFGLHAVFVDVYFLFCGFCILAHTLAIEWLIYFKDIDTVTLHAYEELLVKNVDSARMCFKGDKQLEGLREGKVRQIKEATTGRVPFLGRLPLYNLVCSFLAKLWMLLEVAQVDQEKLADTQLQMFPSVSPKLRMRLLQRNVHYEIIIALVVFFVAIGFIIWLFVMVPLIAAASISPPIYWAVFLVDMILVVGTAWLYIRNTAIIINYTINTSELYGGHLEEANQLMEQMLRRHSARVRGRVVGKMLFRRVDKRLLAFFLREHTRMVTLTSAANGEFVTRILCALLLLNIPLNCIMAYRTLYGFATIPIEPYLMSTIMAGQGITFAIALLPMARVNIAFYRIDKLMPKILFYLDASVNLSIKLKAENLYSGLTDSKLKLGSSFAPGKKVTYNSLYEMLLIYIAFLLQTLLFLTETLHYKVPK